MTGRALAVRPDRTARPRVHVPARRPRRLSRRPDAARRRRAPDSRARRVRGTPRRPGPHPREPVGGAGARGAGDRDDHRARRLAARPAHDEAHAGRPAHARLTKVTEDQAAAALPPPRPSRDPVVMTTTTITTPAEAPPQAGIAMDGLAKSFRGPGGPVRAVAASTSHRPRRDRRPARAERRRQVHDDRHAARPAAARRGPRRACSARQPAEAVEAGAGRRHAADRRAHPRPHGARAAWP